MTIRTLMAFVLTGAVACGGESERDRSSGSGGNGATGAAGGTAGVGGGGGATSGTGGSAGTGGAGSSCPSQRPGDGGACDPEGTLCSYGSDECNPDAIHCQGGVWVPLPRTGAAVPSC